MSNVIPHFLQDVYEWSNFALPPYQGTAIVIGMGRFRTITKRDTSYLGSYEQQQEPCDKTGTNEKHEDRWDNVRRLSSWAILSNWTFDAGFERGRGRHTRSRQEMSVRRLVIELRLEHESQRWNSNSIFKFLSHSECWSSLSGYSSHWLVIIRSSHTKIIKWSAGMIRYCSFVFG